MRERERERERDKERENEREDRERITKIFKRNSAMTPKKRRVEWRDGEKEGAVERDGREREACKNECIPACSTIRIKRQMDSTPYTQEAF
jgi:hypothetical protein